MKNRIPKDLLNKTNLYLRKSPYPLQSILGSSKNPLIDKNSKIVTMGSCFAQRVSSWLQKNGYSLLPHKWGVVYTPQNIWQILYYSFENAKWKPYEPFWEIDSKIHDPYRKSDNHSGPMFLCDKKKDVYEILQKHYDLSRELLLKANVIILTFGLTEVWRNKFDEKAFYAIPAPQSYKPDQHIFRSLSYREVNFYIESSVELIRKYTNANILLSVSPVPLSISFRDNLGAYISNRHSKSKIHSAVIEAVDTYENVYYIPSYEIITNNPKKYYKEDGRHVNKEGIDIIMNCFEKQWVA